MKLIEIDLHVTNRCTNDCCYCVFSSNRICLDELSKNKLQTLIIEAKELGCNQVHITGGEPLLRNDIEEIIAFATKLNIKVRLQTNGALLNPYRVESLINSGLSSIMLSLDSNDKNINDQLRGEGSFNLTMNAISLLLKKNFEFRINSVITRLNYNSIYNLIIFLYNKGIRNYSAFYYTPMGSGKNRQDLWLGPEEYLLFWHDLNEKINMNRDTLNDMNIIIERGYSTWEEAKNIDTSKFQGCGGGCSNLYKNRDYLIIRSDGYVYPCILSIESKPLGNVLYTDLNTIWANSIVWENYNKPLSTNCEKCANNILCNGGCSFYPKLKTFKNISIERCIEGYVVPLCPIMKYNHLNKKMGGSSEDVMQ